MIRLVVNFVFADNDGDGLKSRAVFVKNFTRDDQKGVNSIFSVEAIPKFLAFVGFKASVGAEQSDETTAGLKPQQSSFDVAKAEV